MLWHLSVSPSILSKVVIPRPSAKGLFEKVGSGDFEIVLYSVRFRSKNNAIPGVKRNGKFLKGTLLLSPLKNAVYVI